MRIFIGALTILLLSLSCKKQKKEDVCEEKTPFVCPAVACDFIGHLFEFKLIDKQTGNDLLFGANPRYTINDIKLFEDGALTIPVTFFKADSMKNTIRSFIFKAEVYLLIRNTDVYKLNATFKSIGCCGTRVKSLEVNGQSVCSCGNDTVFVPVR